jgi:hypothetical protein
MIARMRYRSQRYKSWGAVLIHKRLSENVEFSFGKGVGSKIYDALNNADHSVFVLTPYISQGYIDFLLRKKQEGVNVSLAGVQYRCGSLWNIFDIHLFHHYLTHWLINNFFQRLAQ